MLPARMLSTTALVRLRIRTLRPFGTWLRTNIFGAQQRLADDDFQRLKNGGKLFEAVLIV